MKKALKIVWRTLLALFLTVYVVVALLNYSLVQSLVASYAGSRCSEAWGGEVRIGSLGCNPLNHLVLRAMWTIIWPSTAMALTSGI